MPYNAAWKCVVAGESGLTRSSHCIQVQDNVAYVFGGELEPRRPVDAQITAIDLKTGSISRLAAAVETKTPEPRVGPTWSAHESGIYLFGGRGGASMEPLKAGLWRYHVGGNVWQEVEDMKGSIPEGRSYHASAVLGDDLYIHAGCPPEGRLSTMHKYHIPSSTWTELASAPDPPRGGTVIAPSALSRKPVLLRFGGFGGPKFGELKDLAWYDVETDKWTSVEPAEGAAWPEARSVHGFLGLTPKSNAEHAPVAVLFMGEGTPAPAHLGHSGAGNFLADVWVLTHSTKGGFEWHVASPSGAEVPQGRGWFASDLIVNETEPGWRVVISGGLNEKNERLGDVWLLDVTGSH